MSDISNNLANDAVIVSFLCTAIAVAGRLVFNSLKRKWEREVNQENGGTSIRDFIVRTDLNFEKVKTWQREHEGYHDGYREGRGDHVGR